MSKYQIYTVVVAVFVILSLIPWWPRGPQFTCEPHNGGSHQQQYGFPLMFIQRSVSPSACTFSSGQETATDYGYYGTHHVKPLNLIVDVAIWLLVAGGLGLVLQSRSGVKGHKA